MDFSSGHLEWNCIEKLVQQNTITLVGTGHGDGMDTGREWDLGYCITKNHRCGEARFG